MKNFDAERFVEELTRAKARLGKSNKELAEMLGVHRVTFQRWMTGAVLPKPALLDKATVKLNLRVSKMRKKPSLDVAAFVTPLDFDTLYAVYRRLAAKSEVEASDFREHALLKLSDHIRITLVKATIDLRSVSVFIDQYPEKYGVIVISAFCSQKDIAVSVSDVKGTLYWTLSLGTDAQGWVVLARGRLNEQGVAELIAFIATQGK